MDLNKNFWDLRYQNNEIGWDIGYISTPLKKYIDQLTDKNIKILIPGGGNSYEAEYLHNLDFKNVFVLDISPTALTNLKNRVPDFPKNHLINIDFFKLNNSFDLILEQTFFCALTPKLRDNYVLKMNQLLRPNGKLVGLLFNIPLNKDRPPFGGTKKEYLSYFKTYFKIEIMELSYNSISERTNNELFIKLIKK
ncbi:TPMT family class I SAM-dependent methyltransferase [Flavobacteriaceae bacterium]|jgi:SAM-dependent methyltransferase|nr:TPMT family class I SAM-dependent methyltransferase [Flavobacteriaceae bacterium]